MQRFFNGLDKKQHRNNTGFDTDANPPPHRYRLLIILCSYWQELIILYNWAGLHTSIPFCTLFSICFSIFPFCYKQLRKVITFTYIYVIEQGWGRVGGGLGGRGRWTMAHIYILCKPEDPKPIDVTPTVHHYLDIRFNDLPIKKQRYKPTAQDGSPQHLDFKVGWFHGQY